MESSRSISRRRAARPTAALLLAGLWILVACANPSVAPSAKPAPAVAAGGAQASAPASASSPASAPARVSLKTAYTTASATVAPVWLAVDAGGFAEQGLDAEVSFISAGAAILGALSSREAPIVIAGGNQAIEANVQGGQYVVVGSAIPYLTTAVYAVPTIQRPEDLRGQTVGVSNFGATSHVALRVALEHWGLSEGRDVTVIRSGGTPETVAAMQSGAIAGGSFGPPQSFRAQELGFREMIDVTDLRYDFLGNAMVSTRGYVAEHPDVVERYLKALMRGVQAFKTQKDVAVAAIMQHGRIDDRAVAERTWEYFRDKFSDDLALTQRSAENVQRMVAEERPEALALDPQSFMDGSFLDRIRASGYVEQLRRGQ